MALAPGTRLGAYEVLSLVGAGGMGEVYRSRDTKLGRSVALKVLPDAVAGDPHRISRFEREAKALAALNHPHIAALFGMEESGGRLLLVMELVEGETLEERLARGLLAVDDALKIALQIAEALEAAHEAGFVHRDLKPANVKITPDENVKVLDFGLARAMDPAPAVGRASNSPTLSMVATQSGVILGTAAYMSPEQAKGAQADARSDVFSFGVVLYEMLTGRQPFQGETVPEVLASVLTREVDLSAVPPNLNPRLTELLKRCLDKNPKKRWQAVGDLRVELESVAAAPRAAPHAGQPAIARPPWTRAIPVATASLVTAAVAAAIGWSLWPARAPAPIVSRFVFTLPEGQNFTSIGRQAVAISPDGARIVYVANQRLYLRSISELEPRALPGSEPSPPADAVSSPVFSPDGESIVFWSGVLGVALGGEGTLKRIPIGGGVAVTLCQARSPFGMSWIGDQILVGQSAGIVRVPSSGGTPQLLVRVADGEQAHGPQLLPGGDAVLFTLAKTSGADRWDKAQIVVQRLTTGDRTIVLEGGSDARYLSTGHLLYAVGGVVFAVRFDPQLRQVTGQPVPVLEGVRRSWFGSPSLSGAIGAAFLPATAQFSVSATGSIVYMPGPSAAAFAPRQFAFLDRKGGAEPLSLPPGQYEAPQISPDGKRVAFQTSDGKEAIVWISDMSGTSAARRLTVGGNNRLPIWSADGDRVAFQSDREGDLGIFWQRADGTGTAERLTRPEKGASHAPESWSPIGDRFLFRVTKDDRNVTLWTFSWKDRKAEPFGGVQSATPTNAVFSPDGRWVAYFSNEMGTTTLWVQPSPATGTKYEISRDGDSMHALWSRDGKELFYNRPGQFIGRSIITQPGFMLGNPVRIAMGPLILSSAVEPRSFDMTPDGRIVGLISAPGPGQTQAGSPAASQLHIVQNWFTELQQRVPTK